MPCEREKGICVARVVHDFQKNLEGMLLCSTVAGPLCIVVEQLNAIDSGERDSFLFLFVKGDSEGMLKETTDVLKHIRRINFVAEPGKR